MVLSQEQKKVFENLREWLVSDERICAMLFGVTGSGKTAVCLALAGIILEKSGSVLFMVPEISLVPQTIVAVKEYLGVEVAEFHSALTPKKRREEWLKVKSGTIKIVVGTRSAIFAPFNPSLIIMDEEQEVSYKSESSPRFHARDTARLRCAEEGAKLLLVSATPSVETFYMAKIGKIRLETLSKRFSGAVLPDVFIIDMNFELKLDSERKISLSLAKMIENTAKRGEQAILLLDRRGFYTLIRCSTCGGVLMCENCNIPLNFHKDKQNALCHYCGFSVKPPEICPFCQSTAIRFTGFGTQRFEEELGKIFPGIRILRVDADSIGSKKKYNEIFGSFRRGDYDVMLGTRTIAKGLDFENVTLVGVVLADQAIFGQSFKSFERAFLLISQVAGRSGRGSKRGSAAIQTYNPEHEVIKFAAEGDYEKFFSHEIKIRKLLLYPPFSDICAICFSGKNEENVRLACEYFHKKVKTRMRNFAEGTAQVLNPVPAFIKKAFAKYRYNIIIKCKNNAEFRGAIKEVLIDFQKKSTIETDCGRIRREEVLVFVDINPERIF
jgi:primosomal protein N' (replication factor Y)